MAGGIKVAPIILLGLCAALGLAGCSTPAAVSTVTPAALEAPRAQTPLAGAPSAPETAMAYPRYGDSDEYLCNNGPPGEARTTAACARLRGPDAPPVAHPMSRYGDSDDFVCNHGTPGEARTVQACLRLRGPEQ